MRNSLKITKIVKRALKDKEPIIENLGSKVKISYKGKITQPRPLIFPKYIPVDKKLGELCGLYYGEGATSKNSWTSHIQFTNSEPSLVEYFLVLMESIFGFGRNMFSFRIKAGVEQSKVLSKEEIIEFWKISLKLRNNKEIKFYWDKKPKNSRHRIMVTLGSIIFRRTLDEVMDIVFDLSLINSKIRRGFIRGLFAGEGTVSLNGDSLNRIVISQGYRNPIQDKILGKPKREFIEELLKRENIRTHNNTSGMNIVVTNLRNLEIFNNLELYGLHKEKRKKFEFGFMKLKNNYHNRAGISNMEAQFEILNLLLKNGPMSISEISTSRGTDVTTTKQIIKGRKDRNKKGFLNKNYIFISKKIRSEHSTKPISLFEITDKGKVYLEDLKSQILY